MSNSSMKDLLMTYDFNSSVHGPFVLEKTAGEPIAVWLEGALPLGDTVEDVETTVVYCYRSESTSFVSRLREAQRVKRVFLVPVDNEIPHGVTSSVAMCCIYYNFRLVDFSGACFYLERRDSVFSTRSPSTPR